MTFCLFRTALLKCKSIRVAGTALCISAVAVANALREVNWHRVVRIAVITWVIFNQGMCVSEQVCDPLKSWTCEP